MEQRERRNIHEPAHPQGDAAAHTMGQITAWSLLAHIVESQKLSVGARRQNMFTTGHPRWAQTNAYEHTAETRNLHGLTE